MDKIDLPILPATTSLKTALDLLRLMGRSALVISTEVGTRFILDRALLLARGNRAETPLEEIAPGEPALELPGPRRELSPKTRQVLDRAGTPFAIGETEDGSVTVYTRQENIAADMAVAIGYCYCTGPEREICAPGDYPDGYCALGHQIKCLGA